MSEEIKEAPKVAIKPTSRELTLERTVKDAIVIVEHLNLTLQRMGVTSHGSKQWVEEAKAVLNGK